MDQPYVNDKAMAVKDYVSSSIAVIGENIVVRRFVRQQAADGFFATYIHSNHKLGVLVELAGAAGDAAREAGRNVAMQIAAANPRWVRREDVPADVLEHERVIFREQMKESGKPAQVIEKIVEGKLDKFYKENCLVEQLYIRDDKLTVKAYLESLKPAAGALDVRRFTRLQVGEE
jgi:elongation factor Ts